MPVVNIQGVGRVRFPDGMSEAEMSAAIEKEVIPQARRAETLASNPAEYDPSSPEYKARYGPTRGFLGNAWDAFGSTLPNAARGLGQWVGAVSRDDVQAARDLDAPLRATAGGKVGEIAGQIGLAVPALAVPGANTVAGASLVGAGLGAIQPSTSTKETLTNIGLGGGLGGASQWGGSKIAQWAGNRLAARSAEKAAQKAQNAVRDATLADAQAAGYVVPPSTTNPTVTNRLLESLGGKAATAQQVSLKNQVVTDDLVRSDLGLAKDAPLTVETFGKVRKAAGRVYEKVANTGTIKTDATFAQELGDMLPKPSAINLPKETVDQEIGDLVESLWKNEFSAREGIEAVKLLRKRASGNLSGMNATDPAKRRLGMAQRDAAGAIEDQIERHLQEVGDGALSQAFNDARVRIAKSYTAQAALNEGSGHINAAKFASDLHKGKPLSGGMATAARFARAFSKAAQEVKDSGPVSALDAFATGGLGFGVSPAFFAYPFARMATRKALTSSALNRSLATPIYAPGLAGTRALQTTRGLGRFATPLALGGRVAASE